MINIILNQYPINSRNGTASAPKSNKSSPAKDAKPQENPFEEDEWDEESGGALTDTGEPGVPVRALYDYTGAESDELSFRQGECITVRGGLVRRGVGRVCYPKIYISEREAEID